MLHGRVLTLIALPILAIPTWAETPDPYESKVQALAHPRYQEREKAGRELLSAGEPALKALRAAASSSDPELRARAAAIAEQIDRAVRSEKLMTAPKIALKLDKVPLQQAVIEVGRKTGLKMQLDPSKGADFRRPVTFDSGELPFWDAVYAFYAAAGLMENDKPLATNQLGNDIARMRRLERMRMSGSDWSPYGDGVIHLTDGKMTAPVDHSKAIRVRAMPPDFAPTKLDAATDELTFYVGVDPAPGLAVQEIMGVEIRKAKGDNRQALAPAYPAPTLQGGVAGVEQLLIAKQVMIINGDLIVDDGTNYGGSHFPVALKAGGSRPKQLAELEGIVVAKIVTPSEPVVALNLRDATQKGLGKTSDVAMSIVSLDENAKSGQVALRVRVETSLDTVNEMLNFPVQLKGRVRPFVRINRRGSEAIGNGPEFHLADATGKPIKIGSTHVMTDDVNATHAIYECRMTFQKPVGMSLGDITLAIHCRKAVMVEMPFVLKNVPLP